MLRVLHCPTPSCNARCIFGIRSVMMSRSRETQHPLPTKRTTPMPSHTDPFAPPGANYEVIGISNRLRAVLLHVPYYNFNGSARLARDTGLAPSTISRLIRGRVSPSYVVVEMITKAISFRFGKPLDARELFTTNGTYTTPSTCELMDCLGCLPPEAWCEFTDNLRTRWKRQKPGDWSQTPLLEATQKPGGGSA